MFHVKHFVKILSKYAGYSDFFRPFFGKFSDLVCKNDSNRIKNRRPKIRSLFAVLKGIESLAHYLPHISTMTNAVGIDVKHDLFRLKTSCCRSAHNHLPIVSRIGTGGFKKCGAPFQLFGDLRGDLLGFLKIY